MRWRCETSPSSSATSLNPAWEMGERSLPTFLSKCLSNLSSASKSATSYLLAIFLSNLSSASKSATSYLLAIFLSNLSSASKSATSYLLAIFLSNLSSASKSATSYLLAILGVGHIGELLVRILCQYQCP